MVDAFTNEPIDVDALPQLADEDFVAVDPRYLKVRLAGRSVTAAFVLIGGIVVASLAGSPVVSLLVMTTALALIGLSATMAVLEVGRLGYQLRGHDLSLRSGVIKHSIQSLPFSRVQHVNVARGPIERGLGLATLQVSSAGPDITIPGLAEADASRIKVLIAERADVVEEEESQQLSTPAAAESPPPPPVGAPRFGAEPPQA